METKDQCNISSNADVATGRRRCTGACGKWKSWDEFDRKPNGVNGRDSRCKKCISDARKKKRRDKQLAKRMLLEDSFRSIFVGKPDADSVDEFGRVYARLVCDLLEKGLLK